MIKDFIELLFPIVLIICLTGGKFFIKNTLYIETYGIASPLFDFLISVCSYFKDC